MSFVLVRQRIGGKQKVDFDDAMRVFGIKTLDLAVFCLDFGQLLTKT